MRGLAVAAGVLLACGPKPWPPVESVPPEKLPPPVPGWEGEGEGEVQRVAGREPRVLDREGRPIDVLLAEGRTDRGGVVYGVHCVRCHGPIGKGDGPDAVLTRIRPADFTWKSYGARLPGSRMYLVIRDGGPVLGRHEDMPPFGRKLTDHDIASVIAYVRALAE